jgi:hypothetical protein
MEALDAVLRTIRGVWVNHPDHNRAASLKSAQLDSARALGFRIPQTVITNDPDAARELVANARDGAIVKPVRQGRIRGDGYDELFFTSEITDSDALDRLDAEPYVFQELIHKTADLRVTVIGDTVLPVRIDSQGDARARRLPSRGSNRARARADATGPRDGGPLPRARPQLRVHVRGNRSPRDGGGRAGLPREQP